MLAVMLNWHTITYIEEAHVSADRPWPARYCPNCGASMRLADKPRPGIAKHGSAYGELVGFIILLVGAIAVAVATLVFSSNVAAILGVIAASLTATVFLFVGHGRTLCECIACGREYCLRECKVRKLPK